jgi:hypothetical protein
MTFTNLKLKSQANSGDYVTLHVLCLPSPQQVAYSGKRDEHGAISYFRGNLAGGCFRLL